MRPGLQEKRGIALIETSPLQCQNKADLFLVFCREKPAAIISTESLFSRAISRNGSREILAPLLLQRERLEGILNKLGLAWCAWGGPSRITVGRTLHVSYDFLVAQDRQRLKRLRLAKETRDSYQLGLALGYPRTAVAAFRNATLLDYEHLKESLSAAEFKALQRERAFMFSPFRQSQAHWPEELEIARQYQRLIREKSPKLYREILESGADPLA